MSSGKESYLWVKVDICGVQTLQLLTFPLMHPVIFFWGLVSKQVGARGMSAAAGAGGRGGDQLCYCSVKAAVKF